GDPSSHPRIVEPLDVFEHIGPCGIERRVGHAVDPLALEQAEEATAQSTCHIAPPPAPALSPTPRASPARAPLALRVLRTPKHTPGHPIQGVPRCPQANQPCSIQPSRSPGGAKAQARCPREVSST